MICFGLSLTLLLGTIRQSMFGEAASNVAVDEASHAGCRLVRAFVGSSVTFRADTYVVLWAQNPLQVPELLELILSFVPVDGTFCASLLRTSPAFHDHFRPRLWADIDLTGDVLRWRFPLLLDCLSRLSANACEAARPDIRSLAFDIDDMSRERLDTDRLWLVIGWGKARSIKELSINIVGEVDNDDVELDADAIAEIVTEYVGLERLVLGGHVSEVVFARVHAMLSNDMYYDQDTRDNRLAKLELELPPETLLLRAARTETGPALPCFGTLRTLFVAPRRRKYARQLSHGLLSYILRVSEGDGPFQQTLVLGPELAAYLASPLCTSDDRKEFALAQMVAQEINLAGRFQVHFPAGLDLSAELKADPVYQARGMDELILLWYEDEWPIDLPESELSDA